MSNQVCWRSPRKAPRGLPELVSRLLLPARDDAASAYALTHSTQLTHLQLRQCVWRWSGASTKLLLHAERQDCQSCCCCSRVSPDLPNVFASPLTWQLTRLGSALSPERLSGMQTVCCRSSPGLRTLRNLRHLNIAMHSRAVSSKSDIKEQWALSEEADPQVGDSTQAFLIR
jgi:hypothetical protein